MGKDARKNSEGSGQEQMIDENERSIPKKKKNIFKAKTKTQSTYPSQSLQSSKRVRTKIVDKSAATIKRMAKKVNLRRQELSLDTKQDIFQKVVGEVGKKLKKKEGRKQHFLIKKTLRKLIEQRLPVNPKQTEQRKGQAMAEQKGVPVKQQKFEKQKAIASFKQSMGLGFGSIKQQLLSKSRK